MSRIADKSSDYPTSQVPLVGTATPNEEISLYSGAATVSQEEESLSIKECRIFCRWLPFPRIRFEGEVRGFARLRGGILHYGDPPRSRTIDITEHALAFFNDDSWLAGSLSYPEPLFLTDRADEVLFHVPNFFSLVGDITVSEDGARSTRNRLAFADDRWAVAMDEVRNAEELRKRLRVDGGFGLTHVGTLRRVDGETLDMGETSFVFDSLFYFISFLRGAWCGPTLSVARCAGEVLEEAWDIPKLTPREAAHSWFPKLKPPNLNNCFRQYLERWRSSVWREPLKRAIKWYVEANNGSGGVEGSIVLVQTALELLGWVRLVEDPMSKRLSRRGYDDLSASDKLRLLLSDMSISSDVPDSLTSLQGALSPLGAGDAFDAFTKIRNNIVHPKLEHRTRPKVSTSIASD